MAPPVARAPHCLGAGDVTHIRRVAQLRNKTSYRCLIGVLAAVLVVTPCVGPADAQQAKNVVIMIADGWGYNHILATNYYTAGRAQAQPYEAFAVCYPMSTYSLSGEGYDGEAARASFDYVKQKSTDSAAAGTALATGHKTLNGAVGVDADGNHLQSILEYAQSLGKATGVVTTVQISHATPATFVAHSAARGSYEDIARQMILDSAVNVIMGSGNPLFDDNGQRRETPDYKFIGGQETWDALVAGTCSPPAGTWRLVQSPDEFRAVAAADSPPARVIGVMQTATTAQQARAGATDMPLATPRTETVPTLAEMCAAALNVLGQDPEGLVLMVEGGAVDWANHANQTGRMIEEMTDFNDAVAEVVAWIEQHGGWSENLLIVTGDHETGYLMGPAGPDAKAEEGIVNAGAGTVPGVGWYSTGHTNLLIPVFANGDAAELLRKYADEQDPVRGAYVDNTDVAKLMFEAITPQP